MSTELPAPHTDTSPAHLLLYCAATRGLVPMGKEGQVEVGTWLCPLASNGCPVQQQVAWGGKYMRHWGFC